MIHVKLHDISNDRLKAYRQRAQRERATQGVE